MSIDFISRKYEDKVYFGHFFYGIIKVGRECNKIESTKNDLTTIHNVKKAQKLICAFFLFN